MTSSETPGDSDNNPDWGRLALVIDTSAWMRADHPRVSDRWSYAMRTGRLRVSTMVRLEILYAARDGKHFDASMEELSALVAAPLTRSVIRAAEVGMRVLAHRSAGAHRIPLTDYLTAAAAQETGAAVLHYDHDYDTLAEVMEFESIWLAEPGSLP
ncbi:MAG: PIN domain-containing protein [Solirubrobacteraceae bacterium]